MSLLVVTRYWGLPSSPSLMVVWVDNRVGESGDDLDELASDM